jgi:hypothetical protein
MTIRASGIAAAEAVIKFYERLKSQLDSNDSKSSKISYYLEGIEGPVNRVRASLASQDEERLADALLGVPGTARDFDAIDFDPAEHGPTKDFYRDVVRRKAEFFMDLDPSLRR